MIIIDWIVKNQFSSINCADWWGLVILLMNKQTNKHMCACITINIFQVSSYLYKSDNAIVQSWTFVFSIKIFKVHKIVNLQTMHKIFIHFIGFAVNCILYQCSVLAWSSHNFTPHYHILSCVLIYWRKDCFSKMDNVAWKEIVVMALFFILWSYSIVRIYRFCRKYRLINNGMDPFLTLTL